MAAATKDAVLGSAVDLAREVAIELAEDPADVGEYLGMVVEGERLVTHRFASAARGYRGWEWTVTVARVPRGRTATVCEAELLPGPDAVLGQTWLPWSERIRPGDIGPGDVLPFRADDPRLEPGWTPSGDPELDSVAIDELALARVRVLSPVGRDEAAERWYRGPHGPTSAGAVASAAACYSCAFLVPLQGSLGTVFGVCANEWSPDDGVVVSLDHGCGAHSETDVEPAATDWPAPDPLIDELKLELVPATVRAEPAPAPVEEVVAESVDEVVGETAEAVTETAEGVAQTADEVVAEPAEAVAETAETTDEVVAEPAEGGAETTETADEVVAEPAEGGAETAETADEVVAEPADGVAETADEPVHEPVVGSDETDAATSPES
ncbi:DUF3027 domain-containing protein [Cellulomonas sp. URHE0023]|uniref:DUF3027 domain-containing protein n=1 Tax=Cellulomonas sp. URHE0023 TaxID=1380354 RepID=UPI0009E09CBB|nr:DUF3027 domain-containing protein [Cellulomonas sp. URHE0023]